MPPKLVDCSAGIRRRLIPIFEDWDVEKSSALRRSDGGPGAIYTCCELVRMRRGHHHRGGKDVYSLIPDPEHWNRGLDDTTGICGSPWIVDLLKPPCPGIFDQE